MRSRTLIALAAGAFLIAYVVAPVIALAGLVSGIRDGDAEKLNQYADFPAIRSSVKEQLSAAMLADPKLGANPFALALGPMVVNSLVDNMVTPSGLAALIAKGKAEAPGKATPLDRMDLKNVDLSRLAKSVSIQGPFEFRITPPTDDGKPSPQIVFKNLGLFNWKLSDLRVPPGGLLPKQAPNGAAGR